MNTAEYLDRLLVKYSSAFDIYQPYVIHGKEYPAYGYFFSHTEKYVLVREANMWSSDCYEHILFMKTDTVTEELLKEASDIVRDYMEPVLVRKGGEAPEPNHMYSYLRLPFYPKKKFPSRYKKQSGSSDLKRAINLICAVFRRHILSVHRWKTKRSLPILQAAVPKKFFSVFFRKKNMYRNKQHRNKQYKNSLYDRVIYFI